MSDDRASRLRERRRSAKSRAERTAEADAEAAEEPADDAGDPAGDDADTGPDDGNAKDGEGETATPDSSVKDEQVGTYMYLPESQKREIQRLFNVMKAEYEYEFEADFEKNRHFYPLLVRYGLDELDGLDPDAVRERLQELD